ncbi:MAG: hypothetical protein HYV27_05100 [Candidatus Hydrogenedentes bacterium]|nr:hypothetical protein [Candidatus Hydrogenedentota bacterium]
MYFPKKLPQSGGKLCASLYCAVGQTLLRHVHQRSVKLALTLVAPIAAVAMAEDREATVLEELESGGFEVPVAAEIGTIHPGLALAGAHHEIAGEVTQDGRWNHYTIQTDEGALIAVSEGVLRIRLAEFAALEKLEALRRGQAFGMGLKRSAVDVIKTPYEVVKRVVFNPFYALEAVPTEFLRYAGTISDVRQLFQEGIREYAKDAIGYDSAVKGLARAMEIDPKSVNARVREALEGAAWSYWAGYTPLNIVGRHYMPGVDVDKQIGRAGRGNVGSALRDVDRMIRPRSERRQLKRLGISREERHAYTGHPQLAGGRHQLLAKTAYQMKGALNRDAAIRSALPIEEEHLAVALCEEALLLAHYHREQQPLAGVIAPGGRIAGVGSDGTVVIPWAYDHVLWTASVAEEVEITLENLKYLPGAHPVELWSLGGLSTRARAGIEACGVRVVTVDRMEWTEPLTPKGPIGRLKQRYEEDVEQPAASALRQRPDHEPRPWLVP